MLKFPAYRGVAQLGSVSVSGAEGRRFKSSRPDMFYTNFGRHGPSGNYLFVAVIYVPPLAMLKLTQGTPLKNELHPFVG
jgi:hypothetical protein